jgi:hypothetical protein
MMPLCAVLVLVIVGFALVSQQIPYEVNFGWPSKVILPPHSAVVAPILVEGEVITMAFSCLQPEKNISKAHAISKRLILKNLLIVIGSV